MENNRPFPDDILDMVMEAFALLYSPLSRLLSKCDPDEWLLIARTMFSAAHGIISLGLEDLMVAVPQTSGNNLRNSSMPTRRIGARAE